MKYLVVKDKKRRTLAVKNQLKKVVLKAIFLDHFTFQCGWFFNKKPNFINYYKFFNLLKIYNIGKNGALNVIRNRCRVTGRCRSILRYYRISRIVFRELASFGLLVGVKKSSW
jgi:small subunit ribosomal protein S14